MEYVKIQSIKKISKKQKVINFHIKKNENFFANNILTHNCYTKRYKQDYTLYDVEEKLEEIRKHSLSLGSKIPNQVGDYWYYDIGCHTDVVRTWKMYDWIKVFDYFKNSSNQAATFATKFYTKELLDYNANKKVRIRPSLMPQRLSDVMENTTKKSILIKAIEPLMKAGYEVHINYSPVIVYNNWKKDYDELFKEVKYNSPDTKCEVIFLTHDTKKHNQNLDFQFEYLLWNRYQETKRTSYNTEAVRYNYELKKQLINEFKEIYNRYWNIGSIRYIF